MRIKPRLHEDFFFCENSYLLVQMKKIVNFYVTNIIAENLDVSFYVTNKSCHIRKIVRVDDSSHKMWQISR